MRRSVFRYPILLLLVALAHTACGDDLLTTPTDTTPIAPITEMFAGTLSRNGATSHTFTAARSGTITATLLTLSPESVTSIGVSLGTWNGEACYLPPGTARDTTIVGSSVVGTASGAGTFCVRAYDASGSITEPASYEIQVVHP